MTDDERVKRDRHLEMLKDAINRVSVARGVLCEVFSLEALQEAFAVVPASRSALEAALEALADIDAAASGHYDRDGGLPAHLHCWINPPCEQPGGPDCECLDQRPEVQTNATYPYVTRCGRCTHELKPAAWEENFMFELLLLVQDADEANRLWEDNVATVAALDLAAPRVAARVRRAYRRILKELHK